MIITETAQCYRTVKSNLFKRELMKPIALEFTSIGCSVCKGTINSKPNTYTHMKLELLRNADNKVVGYKMIK